MSDLESVKKTVVENKENGLGSSAKELYQMCYLYEGVTTSNFSIYESGEKCFRVDCGKIGSFEVYEKSGGENYELKSDSWIWIENKHWEFRCMSTLYEEYPLITMGEALTLLSE